MTDISKCEGTDCPIRDRCYRYTAPAGHRQSWMLIDYVDPCPEFWPVENANTKASDGDVSDDAMLTALLRSRNKVQ